ncbi:MAG TPA: hypothetical protein VEB39_00535, partial [Sphingomicrobium sp.]|nr:hypothetical protein [Sphingomicrobium sp.]
MTQHGLYALAAALLLTACNSQARNDMVQSSEKAPTARPADGASANAGADKVGHYPGSSATSAGFSTADPIERVIAWYRDPARREEMMYASTERLDDGYLVMGTAGEEGQSFALKLTARPDGGTDGRLIPYDP